jgi:hypothetical protein
MRSRTTFDRSHRQADLDGKIFGTPSRTGRSLLPALVEGKDSPNTKYRSRSALLQERASKLVSGGGELTTRVEPAMIGCKARRLIRIAAAGQHLRKPQDDTQMIRGGFILMIGRLLHCRLEIVLPITARGHGHYSYSTGRETNQSVIWRMICWVQAERATGIANVNSRCWASQHDDRRSLSDPLKQVDHVGVEHADASGRYSFTDAFGVIGAVDAKQSVLIVLK